jgi:hypothetical protein
MTLPISSFPLFYLGAAYPAFAKPPWPGNQVYMALALKKLLDEHGFVNIIAMSAP